MTEVYLATTSFIDNLNRFEWSCVIVIACLLLMFLGVSAVVADLFGHVRYLKDEVEDQHHMIEQLRR